MKRRVAIGAMATALAMGTAAFAGEFSPVPGGGRWGGGVVPSVPGVQGPWGQPVPMTAPYVYAPPSAWAAKSMLNNSVPLEFVQAHGNASGLQRTAGVCPPGGCLPHALPPGAITPPGVPPGPGLSPNPGGPYGPHGPVGAVAAVGALVGGPTTRFPTQRTSVRFVSPAGMNIAWYAPDVNGKPGFTPTQIQVPGRYNFSQAAIYRLKLTDIPNRPGLELYPTLEVVPSNAKTDPFLAHSSVPVSFTDEDLEQVAAGNYVVKVIYLPDPQYQDLAAAGPDEVVSSRLEPGVDPIAEACRRGNILLVIRMGNIDLEAPNTPPMDAPCAYAPRPLQPIVPVPPQLAGPGVGPMGPGVPMMPPGGAMGPVPGMLTGQPGGAGMAVPGMPMGLPGLPGAPTGMQGRPGMLPPVVPNQPMTPRMMPTHSDGPQSKAEDPGLQQATYKDENVDRESKSSKASDGSKSAESTTQKSSNKRHEAKANTSKSPTTTAGLASQTERSNRPDTESAKHAGRKSWWFGSK